MKKIFLILIIVINIPAFSQNNSSINNFPEIDTYIVENWEMITEAGFGYNLIFTNEYKTFKMHYISECTFPTHQVINGKFKTAVINNQFIVTLIFNDFEIDYVLKYPYKSQCTSEYDKLTESEQKYWIECDENGYPLNYVLVLKKVKIKNKRAEWPQHYNDLINHSFIYAKKPDF